MSRGSNTLDIVSQATQGFRSSRQIPIVLPAATTDGTNVNPSEITLTQGGNQFYVQAASAPFQIQPVKAAVVGATNSFGNGQGQEVHGGFDNLIVKNSSLFPVVGLIWVGFDGFINDQFILANSTIVQVANPTFPTPNAANVVNIPDLSGTTITDINGNKFGAISRVSILVFNLDSGIPLFLQKKGSTISGGPSVGYVYPLTPIKFDFGGDYCLNIGGANINAVVSEIYQAIPFA